MIDKVNLAEKFAGFDETYVPKVVAALNDQLVKVVKFQGEYVWHHHDNEDELFWVVKGSIRIDFRDDFRAGPIEIGEGEFCVVPRGVEHRPVAEQEAWVVLFEPDTTVNTGKTGGEFTKTPEELERI